jgi:hypothetical protein
MMSPTEAADKAALEQALETYCAASATNRATIDSLFARGDRWEDIARYCAFHMQVANLHLPPWQPPPSSIGPENMASALAETDPQRGHRAAALLRQRMLRCGVSGWHPDPVAACEAAEAKRATR